MCEIFNLVAFDNEFKDLGISFSSLYFSGLAMDLKNYELTNILLLDILELEGFILTENAKVTQP